MHSSLAGSRSPNFAETPWFFAGNSGPSRRSTEMDALSEALASVRMTGAISYHLVTHGRAVVCFPGEEDIPVIAGDILIIPHGDAHTVSNGSPSAFIDSGTSLGSFLAGDLTTMRLGGGGELTQFVCGYFGCERHADRLFLAGL